MNTATRLVGFGALLALVLGGAWAIGAQVGPIDAVTHEHGDKHSDKHGDGNEHSGQRHGADNSVRSIDNAGRLHSTLNAATGRWSVPVTLPAEPEQGNTT